MLPSADGVGRCKEQYFKTGTPDCRDRLSSLVQRHLSAAEKIYLVIFIPRSLSGDGHEQQ